MSDPSKSIKVSAPGKVILHGEHSVVYGKLALAASLGLRTRLQYEQIDSGGATVEFPGMDLIGSYDVKDLQSLLDTPLPLLKPQSQYGIAHPEVIDHARLLHTVTCFIQDQACCVSLNPKQMQGLAAFFALFYSILATHDDVTLKPFRLVISTELTISAGTGSSASFAVTIAAFLIQLVKAGKFKTKTGYLRHDFDTSTLGKFDKDDLDLISKWAFQAEKVIHGTPSGVDNTVCTYGAMVEFYKGVPPKLVELRTQFKLILVDTRIPRETKAQVEKVAKMRTKHKTMVDGILSLMDETALNALDCIKKINIADSRDLEYYETLGELAEINQNLLRCLNVSHPRLEEVCQVLHERGLRGKLTGAGGGGYAIALVPPHVDPSTVAKAVDELLSRGFGAVLTDLGGCGVSLD